MSDRAEEVAAKARWHSSYTGDLGAVVGFPAARAALAALADAGFVLIPPDPETRKERE